VGSRTSLASTNSLLEAIKATERDPEVKAVEFSFKLHGLQVRKKLKVRKKCVSGKRILRF
jgi:hypothetical protein